MSYCTVLVTHINQLVNFTVIQRFITFCGLLFAVYLREIHLYCGLLFAVYLREIHLYCGLLFAVYLREIHHLL